MVSASKHSEKHLLTSRLRGLLERREADFVWNDALAEDDFKQLVVEMKEAVERDNAEKVDQMDYSIAESQKRSALASQALLQQAETDKLRAEIESTRQTNADLTLRNESLEANQTAIDDALRADQSRDNQIHTLKGLLQQARADSRTVNSKLAILHSKTNPMEQELIELRENLARVLEERRNDDLLMMGMEKGQRTEADLYRSLRARIASEKEAKEEALQRLEEYGARKHTEAAQIADLERTVAAMEVSALDAQTRWDLEMSQVKENAFTIAARLDHEEEQLSNIKDSTEVVIDEFEEALTGSEATIHQCRGIIISTLEKVWDMLGINGAEMLREYDQVSRELSSNSGIHAELEHRPGDFLELHFIDLRKVFQENWVTMDESEGWKRCLEAAEKALSDADEDIAYLQGRVERLRATLVRLRENEVVYEETLARATARLHRDFKVQCTLASQVDRLRNSIGRYREFIEERLGNGATEE